MHQYHLTENVMK